MNDQSQPHVVQKTAVEARQGISTGVVRWVLGVSLVLAVVGLIVSYLVA